jgi:hypothetical protein
MRRQLSPAVLVVFSLFALSFLLLAAPAFTHHGFQAEFDGSKLIYITGVLTKFEWENPHIYIGVDAKDASGKVTSWTFEGASPNVVKRTGTQRTDLIANIGKTITVRACPGKDGTAKGAAETIKVADGRELVIGGRRYLGESKGGEQY